MKNTKVNFIIGSMSILLGLTIFASCNEVYKHPPKFNYLRTNVLNSYKLMDSLLMDHNPNAYPNADHIFAGRAKAKDVLQYARTFEGIPYVWGATNPTIGFDCSGFIAYVFQHFHVQVPRTSVSYTNIDGEVPLKEAKPGDIILFTGTDEQSKKTRQIGHMGMIEGKKGNAYSFIHASSGKANAVTISELDPYYKSRMVKIIRVFR